MKDPSYALEIARLSRSSRDHETAVVAAERSEATLKHELDVATAQLSETEAGRANKANRLQIRARVSTNIPAGSTVLISPHIEGRSKEFGELVGRTMQKIHENGGIKVKFLRGTESGWLNNIFRIHV